MYTASTRLSPATRWVLPPPHSILPAIAHAECELLGAYVSALSGYGYCQGIHTDAAVASGIHCQAFSTLPSKAAPAYGGVRGQPAFACVTMLTSRPASVDRHMVDALSAAG